MSTAPKRSKTTSGSRALAAHQVSADDEGDESSEDEGDEEEISSDATPPTSAPCPQSRKITTKRPAIDVVTFESDHNEEGREMDPP